MNIILAEEHNGRDGNESSFSKASILVGRDANDCDVSFDNSRYPMVSRKHAELRWQGGKWSVADLGSSYGTYINGQKIDGTAGIAVGDRVQFGLDGPAVRIIWFEVESDADWEIDATPTPPGFRQPTRPANSSVFTPEKLATEKPSAPSPMTAARFEFIGGPARPDLTLTQPLIWIGRDPGCEIVFDASSTTVSRKHASIANDGRELTIADNNSFNGTLVNGQRISSPISLHHGDEVQFGLGGPVIRLNSPQRIASDGPVQRKPVQNLVEPISSKTMVAQLDRKATSRADDSAEPQLLMTLGFDGKNTLTIGRGEGNDIRLDGLQISNRHARIQSSFSGVVIEDLNSTNGLFVNGSKATKQGINISDSVQIGTFLIRLEPSGTIGVYDTRSKTRIDVVSLTRDVKGRFGSGKVRLFNSVSLSIKPNEFIGLLGPSGAGKSTLMEALAGVRPATAGNVLINNHDLYRHLDSLKQSIGYVPQDDIIHRELTVYRTLYYVAKLRLSRDVSSAEISAMIDEVLDVTGLTDRRDVAVHKLSGGQRKRVSIAVELVTKPSVIFLDEPTSGLDPATEDKIMKLFRHIAESGRTVVMTTHAMENVRLFDKIVVLMRGRLVFFGKPDEALKHLGAANFKELYEKLEDAVDGGTADKSNSSDSERADDAATGWQRKFATTPQYREYIAEPQKELGSLPKSGTGKRRRLGILGSIRQWSTLSRRYIEILLKDKLNLFILLAQAPIIALLTFFVMNREFPRDFVYFVVALVAIWFGLSVAAREIIRERPVYKRERMFNLGILPYLASKLFVLGVIVMVQCFFLFVPLKIFDLAGLMSMPGEFFGVAQFWAMLLTASVGVAIGLFVSAIVRTPEVAASIIPLILIPQILFSGLVGVPNGINKAVGLLMPSAWAFDTMKRFSTLDTLEPEGAKPRGGTKGLGLYEFIESENDRTLEKAKRDVDDFKRLAAGEPYDGSAESPLNEKITVPEMKKLPADRSGYVTFLHPWMNEVLNQFVLMLMFGLLVVATLIALRLKDRE